MKRQLGWGMKYLAFDTASGEYAEVSAEQGKLEGLLVFIGGVRVALYPERGRLFAQVGELRFDLGAPDCRLAYQHHPDATTTVTLTQGESCWSHSYEAWWKNTHYEFIDVCAIPELSDDAEQVSYIRELMDDATYRQRMLLHWACVESTT